MKRYSLSILLSLFLVAGIGVYYVYAAADRLPEYKLSMIQGDDGFEEKIELQGMYTGRVRAEQLSVTAEGSDYESRRSLFRKYITDARSGSYRDSDITKMIEAHPGFMRGKGLNSSFLIDQEWVIYAKASVNNKDASKPEVILNVEFLNQGSGKISSYETIVDTQSAYQFINILDVLRIGDELHLLTNQRPIPDWKDGIVPVLDEYLVYVMDAATGQMIRIEKLEFEFDKGKGLELRYGVITNEKEPAGGDYAVFIIRSVKINGETAEELLYSYSYKSGKMFALPDTTEQEARNGNVMYSLNGHLLTVVEQDLKNSVISTTRFNLSSGLEETGMPPITAKQLGENRFVTVVIQADRVYILFEKENIPTVLVADATNGAILYEGQVIMEGLEPERIEQPMDLNSMNISIK